MIAGAVARRYAKALYELASEDGNLDEVASALSALADGVAAVDAASLAPGVLDRDARRKLGATLATTVGIDSTLGKFVRLLADRDRLVTIPGIKDWFVRIQDRAAGRVRLTLRTATPLDQPQIDAVVAAFRKITDGNITAEVETDSDLLGGAVVELEGRVFDGSVKTRLIRLAARMAGES